MKSKTLLIVLSVVVVLLIVAGITLTWGVGIYNSLVAFDEQVKQAWSQVENQYQRRLDLIPNLVETVKGYAAQEREIFEKVAEARSRVGQFTVTSDILTNPDAFQKFQQAQDQLGSALTRLLAVAENYPNLKSNENFLTLQAQLEGTENRIAVERKRFNEAVQNFNTKIRRFPASIVAGVTGFSQKDYFHGQPGAEQTPRVKF